MRLFNELKCVSIAVESIPEALPAYTDLLGLEPLGGVQTSQRGFGLRWIELGLNGVLALELIEPTGEGGPVDRFLSQPGPSHIYQVRFSVADIDVALDTLQARGARVLRGKDVPGQPRVGWVHPSSTKGMLLELVEYPSVG